MPTPSVTLVRVLDVPARDVYAAWLDPSLLQRWLAPGPQETNKVEVDARVGGRYHLEGVGPDGKRHITRGEYLELVPDRRIVKTWVYTGDLAEFVGHVTRVTVDLRALGPARTELTLTHEQTPSDQYRGSLQAGWAECLEGLATALGAPASESAQPARAAAPAV